MSQTHIDEDAIILETFIPEGYSVAGLEYGAFLSGNGCSGYYVRPIGTETWGVAWQTPASDELHDSDEAIVAAIREELA